MTKTMEHPWGKGPSRSHSVIWPPHWANEEAGQWERGSDIAWCLMSIFLWDVYKHQTAHQVGMKATKQQQPLTSVNPMAVHIPLSLLWAWSCSVFPIVQWDWYQHSPYFHSWGHQGLERLGSMTKVPILGKDRATPQPSPGTKSPLYHLLTRIGKW